MQQSSEPQASTSVISHKRDVANQGYPDTEKNMFLISKIFTAGSATIISAIILATTASAQEVDKIDFRFDAVNSIADSYDTFQQPVNRACNFGSALNSFSKQSGCHENLIGEAMAATGRSGMIAHHRRQVGGNPLIVSLAER